MQQEDKAKPVEMICGNCYTRMIGLRINGITKVQCPRCGAVMVSKVMSRRHIQTDIYAPKGQQII